jgi:hypothetical protein
MERALKSEPAEPSVRYSRAELVELRRQVLRFARSVPPGPARNQHRQIAFSLRRLFRTKAWLDVHAID